MSKELTMSKDKDKDAYDLSDEDFDQMLNEGQTAITDPDDGEGEEIEINLEGDDEGGDDGSDNDDDGGDDLDLDLNLDDEDLENVKPASPQMIDLVHNGKTVSVTIEQARNLAQKGYDYEDKTAKLAPHRRLVQLVEEDEGLQDVINNYVTGQTLGELPKREDFETEDEWFAAGINKAVSNVAPFTSKDAAPTQTDVQTDTQAEPPIVTEMRQRDPDNYDTVAPHFIKAAEQLTVAQYKQVSSSKEGVIKLYDMVKQRVLKGPASSQSTGSQGKQKTFNLRSNRSTSGKRAPKKNVWDLSNKDFEKQLQRAKGY
jgi:hypothetical protein